MPVSVQASTEAAKKGWLGTDDAADAYAHQLAMTAHDREEVATWGAQNGALLAPLAPAAPATQATQPSAAASVLSGGGAAAAAAAIDRCARRVSAGDGSGGGALAG